MSQTPNPLNRWVIRRLRSRASYQDSMITPGCRAVYTPYGIVLAILDRPSFTRRRLFCSITVKGRSYRGSFVTAAEAADLAPFRDIAKSFMRRLLKEYPEVKGAGR